jgi:hypothetical protein
MAVQYSVDVRNAMLDAIEAAIGVSAVLKIFSGAKPADCSAGNSGTELVSYDLASNWAAAASSGSKAFNDVPISEAALATGVAGHYRIYASDGATCHEQGTITATGGGGDMTVDNTSITSGQAVNVTGFTKTMGGA